MRWLFSFLLFALLGAVQALSSSGSRTLVVLEELAEKDKYSEFWKDLTARGFQLSFESPKNTKLSLFLHDELAYDHLILFPPKSKAYGPALTASTLLEFVSKEGNILLALSGSSPVPTNIVSLLLELDIHLPTDRNSVVVDHFNYDVASAAEKHDVLLIQPPAPLRADVRNYFAVDSVIAVPRAVGHTLGNTSPLLAPILRAPKTAYTYNPKEESDSIEDLFATGDQLAIVSAMQARNSGRFTILGSTELLENDWFNAKVKQDGKDVKTSNREFAKKLSGWTFKESGVLKVGRLHHYLNEGPNKNKFNATMLDHPANDPTIYRIKNDVMFLVELSEYDTDRLTPFLPPTGDAVQLEFTMLSPFHRLSLQPLLTTSNSTIFGASFRVPDQHGIFNFRVNYKRPFMTNVDEKRQVTIRHFAHDEWPRSWRISAAWTWIAGIWVTVAGWLAFLAIWLYSAPTDTKTTVKKSQ